jgi:hypothetical protein
VGAASERSLLRSEGFDREGVIQAGRGDAAKLSRLLGVFSFRGGDQGFAAASGPVERTFAWLNQFRRLRVRLGRTATRKPIPNQSVNRVLRRTFALKMQSSARLCPQAFELCFAARDETVPKSEDNETGYQATT